MSKIIICCLFFVSCVVPSLKDVKIYKAETETESIYYKKGEVEIRIYANDPLFDDFWAVNSDDLKKILLKLKSCEK